MFTKHIELKPISEETEEIRGVKDIAKEMLKRFYARIERGAAVEGNEVKKHETKEVFPDRVEDINLTEYLGGSSGVKAGYFNEELFVIKKARESFDEETGAGRLNTEQITDEYVADRIYEALGLGVSASRIYDNGRYKVSKFVPGKDSHTFSKDRPEFEKIKNKLQKGFVLDCLLANWDVIGTAGGDNIRLGDDGKVYRLDNGGALRFRARGEKKGSDFSGKVGEIDSLRARNELFSDISDDEVRRQIDEILESQDKIFTAIDVAAQTLGLPVENLEEVRSIIKTRIEYLRILREGKKEKEKKTDKGIYESIVTNNYFEGWEELELEGNPEIKDQIRENIIRAEKDNQPYYERSAANLGISVEEFKRQLQEKIEDMINRAEFFRATQLQILEKIMNVDGRWKNQFETGTSQGTLDPYYRAKQEKNMFGFEDDFEKNKHIRPIYGYFSDNEHGGINYYKEGLFPTSVSYYGEVNIKIKKDKALRKSTITFHDSLGPDGKWPPTPAVRPHFTSFQCFELIGKILAELKKPSRVNWGESYTEVQYHGQLTMDDVESIHVSTKNGLYPENIREVQRIFGEYKKQHPESTIELIEF